MNRGRLTNQKMNHSSPSRLLRRNFWLQRLRTSLFLAALALLLLLRMGHDDEEHDDNTAPLLRMDRLSLQASTKTSPTLHVVGERHSGTEWLIDYLSDCFNTTVQSGWSREAFWFQDDAVDSIPSAVVVAVFRHVVPWTAAMMEQPLYAPLHANLSWHQFVTRPWTMPRSGKDVVLDSIDAKRPDALAFVHERACGHGFRPMNVVPCLESYDPPAVYELHHNCTGEAYRSIVDLRRDKIGNFLSMANFFGVGRLETVQWEELTSSTHALLTTLESILGRPPSCQAVGAPRMAKHPRMPSDYYQWMEKHVDWETEALIGYRSPEAFVATVQEE